MTHFKMPFVQRGPLLCAAFLATTLSRSFAQTAPITALLPSGSPSGIAVNDRVPIEFFPAQGVAGPAPAVVLLHPLGASDLGPWRDVARQLARTGIGGVVMTLPYHMSRLPRGEAAGHRYIDADPANVTKAFRQASSDVRTVVDWLLTQPSVDPARVGAVGVSLGAIVTHLAMGRDPRITAGVAILGGGDFVDQRLHGALFLFRPRERRVTPEQAADLRIMDPLTFANANRPRRVLMIQAARDDIVPVYSAVELWNALGRPPIQWIDGNHFALSLGMKSVVRTSLSYLRQVWSGVPAGQERLPHVSAPLFRFGLVSGMGARITPAVEWQALSLLSRRDHISLLHATLGLTGRGPFAALAVSATRYIDVGYGSRIHGGFKPYVALHVSY